MIARGGTEGASRREFLKMLGGGLLVVLVTRDLLAEPAPGASLTDAAPPIPEDVGAWLHIDENGAVTVFTGKVEFGQGIRTSLAQEIAEELRVPLSSVRLVMGDTMLTPFDMGTFGSRSTPQMGTQLRKVGATARERLVALAAEHWHVDPGGLTAAGGRVTDPRTHRSLRYGELTAGRTITATVNDAVALTPKAHWTAAGTSAGAISSPGATSTRPTCACRTCCTRKSSARRRSAPRSRRSTRAPPKRSPASWSRAMGISSASLRPRRRPPPKR